MKYHCLICIIFLVAILLIGCTPEYVDSQNAIVDIHEKDIKDVFIKSGVTKDKVKDLDIQFIGEVEDYLLYKASGIDYKDSSEINVGEISFPTDTNKTFFAFDKNNKFYYPISGLLHSDLYDYAQEVLDLMDESSSN